MKGQRLRGLLNDRLNIFFILAFLPLIPSELYQIFLNQALGVVIPLYSFLILLMKRDRLSEYVSKTSIFQRILGVMIVFGSVFAYYAVASFVPHAAFYGLANYTLHLIGLFLIFFKVSAFKQGFTAFFLIVASGLTGLTFRWIEVQMSPTVPYYVSLFSSLLTLSGISHTMPDSTSIFLHTPRGILPVAFEAGCIGIYSVIIFSIIIVITMIETSTGKRTKLLWSALGLIGVFVLNVIRLFTVIVSMNFYGWDFGQRVHQVIGYSLFLLWLAVFLLLFTKRKDILGRIQLIHRPRSQSELPSKRH